LVGSKSFRFAAAITAFAKDIHRSSNFVVYTDSGIGARGEPAKALGLGHALIYESSDLG